MQNAQPVSPLDATKSALSLHGQAAGWWGWDLNPPNSKAPGSSSYEAGNWHLILITYVMPGELLNLSESQFSLL